MTLHYSYLVEQDDFAFVAGGNWSAGGMHPKKLRSMRKYLKEEGFDVNEKKAFYVWLSDESQTGVFVFKDDVKKSKLRNAYSLAAVAARRVDAPHPFVGIFAITESLWWVFSTDASGSVHPVWGDFCGTQEEVNSFVSQYQSAFSEAKSKETFVTPESAWGWLLAQEIDLPRVKSVASGIEPPSPKVLMALGIIGSLVVGGLGAGAYFYKRQMDEAKRRAEIEAANRASSMNALALMNKNKELEEKKKELAKYWENYPRPWLSPHVSWSKFLETCRFSPRTNGKGWELSKVTCALSGQVMNVTREWTRQQFGLLRNAPGELLDPSGDKSRSSEVVNLPLEERSLSILLPNSKEFVIWWADYSNRMSLSGIVFSSGQYQSFSPPYPEGVPDEVRSSVLPPVLWSEYHVVITMPFEPSKEFEAFMLPNFLPESMEITGGDSPKWVVKGVAYANP